MATQFELTAVFEAAENNWVQGRIVEIPGVITAARTLEEAQEMLADALREYMLAADENGGEAPAQGDGRRLAVTLAF